MQEVALWRLADRSFRWWEDKLLHKVVALDPVRKELSQFSEDGSKSWKWLARCFAAGETENGLGYKFNKTNDVFGRVFFGEMKKSKLEGFGLEIPTFDQVEEGDSWLLTASEQLLPW